MYLTKLLLDPQSPQARRDLASAYEMHRTLSRVFAADADTPPGRFLWRLESCRLDQPEAVVLVQSAEIGNWGVLERISGYVHSLHGNKPVALDQLVQDDRRYRFRLLANPTVTRNGKRYGLTDESEQLAWLHRQAERSGFVILGAERTRSERWTVRKAGQPITVQAAGFDGVLGASDAVQLRGALLTGIGHAKALGLGLLSLAPL